MECVGRDRKLWACIDTEPDGDPVNDPDADNAAQAALSGSQTKAPGFSGAILTGDESQTYTRQNP
jgi:hypothetical protein